MIQKTTSPPVISSRLAAQPLYAGSAALLTKLRGLRDGGPFSVGFTSALPGEGVSTLAANLAICAASSTSEPVLLIDTHSQTSPLAHFFGAPSYPGFADVLSGRATCAQALRPTRCERLTLLTAGTQAQELAARPEVFTEHLAELQRRYTYLICDLAPVTESNSSAALAGLLDGVVLVVEAGKAQAEAVKRARDRLSQAEARLLGVVLNKRARKVPTWLEM